MDTTENTDIREMATGEPTQNRERSEVKVSVERFAVVTPKLKRSSWESGEGGEGDDRR